MIVLLPFVINAGMNFVLGLLVALFLGPDAFGIYAIGASILVLVNTALVDWLKLSAIRFYSLQSRESQPEIRATLDMLAVGVAVAVSVALVIWAASGVTLHLPTLLVAAAVAGGVCAGLFDFHGAIARALYLDRAYARLIIIKNLLALLLMVGVAWAMRDPTLVLLGGLASAAIALISVRHVLADAPLSFRNVRRDLVWTFARYGFPLVWANAIYSLMPLVNRSALAGAFGYAEAGYFSLASDMGIRLFGTLAATLEIVLLREVVRLEQSEGIEKAHQRIAANLPVVLLLLLPVAIGWWLVLPSFEAVFVPAQFRGHFLTYMLILTPAFLGLGVFQAGLNPVFLIAKRTGVATAAALVGLAINLALIWLSPATFGPELYAYAQLAGFVTAFLVTAVCALTALQARLDLRAISHGLLAALVMTLTIWPLRGRLAPVLELVLLPALGTVIYMAVILAFDTLGCRAILRQLLAGSRGNI